MSQNPLAALKRAEPRRRGDFPDEGYQRRVLDPQQDAVEQLLGAAALDVYTAHALVLGEQRIVDSPVVAAALGALRAADELPEPASVAPDHPLSRLEARVVAASSAELLHARAREEIVAAAARLVLRDRVLTVAEAVLETRETLAELAGGNLTTMLLATANGQVVGPSSLGHYLAAQLAPLGRTCERLRGAFERLNRSPLGAVAGLATAMPLRRGRTAELLGFDGVVDSTFDAVAGADVLVEPATTVALAAAETSRLAADLSYWARDDVGLLTPSEEFVHSPDAQPQRRDPLVLEHLRVQLAELAAAPATITAVQLGRQMLGGDASQAALFLAVERQLAAASETFHLLADVLRTAVVNRAMFAHRTNRGFATSSELADLLAIDFRMPRQQAQHLARRIVVEATETGIEATTLRPELIDRVALREIGEEIGIDPELLARCLAPRRFIERRDVTGGPAPRAVGASLDREGFAARRDRAWLDERRAALAAARADLHARRDEVIAAPEQALTRRPGRANSAAEVPNDRIDAPDLT